MGLAVWILLFVVAVAVAGGVGWAAVASARRAARSRRRALRWDLFAETCPSRPVAPGATLYPLVSPPGPAGALAVEAEGLCVRLAAYPERTFWLPWAVVYSLDPGQSGGAMLRLASGVEMHLSADACRAVWAAQARVGRRAQPPAEAPSAETAS